MSRRVTTVSFSTSFAKCWELIFKKGIHGLPVVDNKKYLLGIIAEEDLLGRLYPSYKEFFNDITGSMDLEGMEEKIHELTRLKAEDIMNKKVFTTAPQVPILRALSLMIVHQVRQLPVIDKKKKVIGIISKGDIFDALFKKHLKRVLTNQGKII
ncbi:CBS domain-containing protein [Candidatus Gottesmanbacteria bacterium]|nr:CBS domain-containing protein [Candidatus Gottesmanbacteria bacterium]